MLDEPLVATTGDHGCLLELTYLGNNELLSV